jgi:hypothetical protein
MAIEAPAFHDIDLVCEIYNETTLNQYNLDLKKWESNIQQKWERFEIDDEEYEMCLRSGALDDTNKQQQQKSTQNQFHQGSATLQMCKTLPPVLVNYELDESNVDRTRRLRANIKRQMNIRPQMPTPELLHLAFTARTLVYQEYLDLCHDTSQLDKFFIDTCLGGDYRIKSSKKRSRLTEGEDDDDDEELSNDDGDEELDGNNNEPLTVNVEEADLLRGTLSDLLRNLLSDRIFADTLPEMIAEPIPYFTQLQYTPSPRNSHDQRQDSNLLKPSQYRAYLDDVNIPEHDQSLAWSIGEQQQQQTKDLKQVSSTPASLSDYDLKQNLEENQSLKNNPNITSLVEDTIENTIWNILQEAYHNEFSLTARPRLIALPPKRHSSLSLRGILQQTDSNQPRFSSPPLIMTESFD